MRSKFTLSNPRDRARSVAATAGIHFALGVALLTGLAIKADRRGDDGLKTFDVKSPPTTPPPPVEPAPSPERRDAPAPPGRTAEPSPLVVPPAKLPTVQPSATAPLAGRGLSATSGSALSGAGTGSGGTGVGGGGGRSIGTEASLLSGNRGRVPRELLRAFDQNEGIAHLLLTIGESGDVTGCSVIQGTGSSAVDQALCQIMLKQSRWSPALDREGRPISVQLRYTSVWRK